ncbi:MAG: choice-of-anchor T family protein [Thermoplasmatota archaeon]
MIRTALPISIAILLLMSGVLIFHNENEVSAVGSPAITITIDQASQNVSVEPGNDGILVFTGMVEAVMPYSPDIQQLIVTLMPEAEDWPISSPPNLMFNSTVTELPFEVTVQVPVGTPHMKQDSSSGYQLEVSGRWNYSPGVTGGTIPSATAIINVDPYFGLALGCNNPYISTERGKTATFELLVINEGNTNEIVRLEIDNDRDLLMRDVDVILPESDVSADPVAETIVVIDVETSLSTPLTDYRIEITAYSVSAGNYGGEVEPQQFTLTLDVERESDDPEPPVDDDDTADDDIVDDDTSDDDTTDDDDTGDDDIVDDDTADDDTTDDDVSSSTTDAGNTAMIVILVIAAVVIILVAMVVFFMMRRSRKRLLE